MSESSGEIAASVKRCHLCNETKPVEEFSPDRSRRSGRCERCKLCRAKTSREYRYKNLEKVHAREREYASSEIGRMRNNAATQRYKAKNRDKKKAHGFVAHRLRDGSMVRPETCEVCGSVSVKLHAHHDDYSRPADVRWLCIACHNSIHKKKRDCHGTLPKM